MDECTAFKCEHKVYRDNHCAEMTCRNYIGKCPRCWF